jgi:hypothetical protein
MGYDIGEIYQSNSDFLKAEDIGANFWTVTINKVDMKSFDDGSRKLYIAFEELDKGMVLNKTNADTLGDLYGRNTDGWMGRQIMLMTMPVDYQGKKVQAIRLRAPAQQQSMPPRQPGQLQPQANTAMGGLHNSPQRPLSPPQNYQQASGGNFNPPAPPPAENSDIPF